AVTGRGKKASEFSYFDGDIYVGVGFLRVAELEKEFSDPKAFFWARGSAKSTRVLYDPKGILKRILACWRLAKPTQQILEKSLWHQVLKAKKKPSHFGIDYPTSRGLKGTKDASEIYRSTLRLCSETLRLIRNDFRKKAKHKRLRALLAEPLERHRL